MGAFDLTVGVLLIGLFFNTYLYGLVTYQFIVYKKHKFNDAMWIKALVVTLFVLDTAHSAIAIYAAWDMCVTNYNNPASLAFIGWPDPFTAVVTSITAVLSQIFLIHRVLVLTKSRILSGLIGILSFVGCFFGIYAGVRAGIINEAAKLGPVSPYVICWLGFQTAADLLITMVLSFVLARSRTGFRKTDTIINRLIRGAIQTGLFVSVFALGDLFSFVLHGDTNLYAMFAYPIGRIYTNTLLDTLNARADFKINGTGTMDADTSKNTYRLHNHTQTLAGPTMTIDAIHVQKDIITDRSSMDGNFSANDTIYSHSPHSASKV